MKTIHFTAIIAGVAFSFFSCTQDDDTSVNSVTNTLLTDSWRVADFSNAGQNVAASYAGYDLYFSESNVVDATNGTDSVSGAWTVAYDDDMVNVSLDFGTDSLFDDMSQSWEVQERTDTQVRFRHEDAGGETDMLRLIKN
jgi:hypothetical protein